MVEPACFFALVKTDEATFIQNQTGFAKTLEPAGSIDAFPAGTGFVDALVVVIASSFVNVVMVAARTDTFVIAL